MSLFSPAWKSDNIEKALKAVGKAIALEAPSENVCIAAVEKLQKYDIGEILLEEIACKAPFVQVRLAATKKVIDNKALLRIALHPANSSHPEIAIKAVYAITDPDILREIALKSNDKDICLKAIKRIASLTRSYDSIMSQIAAAKIDTELCDVALSYIKSESEWAKAAVKSNDSKLRKQAVQKLDDNRELYSIATGSDPEDIRLAAAKRITDPQFIFDVITTTDSDDIRLALMEKTTDQEVFFRIAESSSDKSTAMTAIKKIDDQSKLRKLVSSARLIDVRAKALRKLKVNGYEKKLLSYNILPKYGQTDIDYAFKKARPEDIPYLKGYEAALLKAATEAETPASRSEAIALLSNPENIKTAMREAVTCDDPELCLKMLAEKTNNKATKQLAKETIREIKEKREAEENKKLFETVLECIPLWVKEEKRDNAINILTQRNRLDELMKYIIENDNRPADKLLVIVNGENPDAAKSAANALQKIPGYYEELIKKRSVEKLMYFLYPQTVSVLEDGLNSPNHIYALRCSQTLKQLYKSASDTSIKSQIKQIPQKTYLEGYSIGSKADGCHDDVPTVSFYLDD